MHIIELMLPMRDGTRLFTRCVLPAGNGRFPVVFSRSAYAAVGEAPDRLEYDVEPGADDRTAVSRIFNLTKVTPANINDILPLLEGGYAAVSQNARGTGSSDGVFHPHVNEREDALYTLEWLSKQDFWNGELYAEGGSYNAYVQLAYLDAVSDILRGVSLRVPFSACYDDFYVNGVFRQDMYLGWYVNQYEKKQRSFTPDLRRLFAELKKRPLTEAMKELFGSDSDTVTDVMKNPDKRSSLWRGHPFESAFAAETLKAPILLISGWYDIFLTGTLRLWNSLPEKTRARSAAIIGPWNHSGAVAPANTPLPLPGSALPQHYVTTREWFDYIRLGKPPVWSEPGMLSYYDVGEGAFHKVSALPDVTGETTAFYASDGGRLSERDEGLAPVSIVYDPENPPYFKGSDSAFETVASGLQPQGEPGVRPDVLSFVSEPLDAELPITGRPQVSLEVSSDRPDTEFYVMLSAVTRYGTFPIHDSVSTLRREHPEYRPGEAVSLTLALQTSAWTLRPGDRLRLDVAPANYPTFALHKNGAGPMNAQAEPARASNTVYAVKVELPMRKPQ